MRDTWCIYKPEEMLPRLVVMVLAGIPSESDDYDDDDDVLAEEDEYGGRALCGMANKR